MKNAMKALHDTIEETAELITKFNPSLAHLWRTQPFNRVNVAYAFAAGFAKSDEDDINANASLVMQVAILDREIRREAV